MPDFSGKIDAPILSVIARELLVLLRSDAAWREILGANAPRACYPNNGTVTNTAITVINEARSGNGEIFYQLAIVFDGAAGAGRYRIDGPDPSTTVGAEIPAGGGTLLITGHDNIKNFAMTAQGATTLPFFRYLFK